MSPKMFSIALLASAIPIAALANAGVTLTESDFRSAQRVKQNGEVIVNVKLSKSGKAKLKKLNEK